MAQQTVTQHFGRFWTPTCIDDSRRLKRCHWKLYEILVPTIYRTSKSDSVCGQGVYFGEVHFWNPRWSRSRVGHGLILGVDVLTPPPSLLGLLQVLAGPLHCS
jgi:hypothetical protein